VFRLRGADVYRVESIEAVPGTQSALVPSQPVGLTEVRAAMARLSGAGELAALLDGLLDELERRFGVSHAMVLMRDPARGTLYSVASRGYAQSGIGAEVRPGEGVIGTAALARVPIRVSHATSEFGYGRAMRADAARHGVTAGIESEIPLPGLAESQSQIAVPILAGDRLLGVLFAETTETARYGSDEEDAFSTLAARRCGCATMPRTTPSSWATTTSSRASPERSCGGSSAATRGTGAATSATASCGSTRRSGCRT
jgi:adenylate cyclase